MKKKLLILAFGVVAHLHGNAAETCTVDKLKSGLECLTKVHGRADRAGKLLEQRLPDYLKEIEKLDKPDDKAKAQKLSENAVKAQEALKNLKTTTEQSALLKQRVNDYNLRAAAGGKASAALSLAEQVAQHGQTVSEKAATSKAAEEALQKIVGAASKLPRDAPADVALSLLRDMQAAGKDAAQKKQDLADATASLVELADKTVEPERALVAEIAKQVDDSDSAVRKANNAMLDMLASLDKSAISEVESTDRQIFLDFLESHPMLESELSGSGLQISSTAGSGRLTMKHEFLGGRRNRYWFALSGSAPIAEDSGDSMAAIKNNAYLDKLADDTTVKGEVNYLNPSRDGKSYMLYGASAEVGYKKYTYLDPTSSFVDPAKPRSIEKNDESYMYSLYAGYSPRGYNDLVIVRYSRQYSYKEQDSATICPPAVAGTPYTVCPSGRLGAPRGTKYGIWSGEVRHKFKDFAIAPRLSYDRKSKVRALAIPIFVSFINRTDGIFGTGLPQLSAGLQYSWRSDTKSSFGLFAGVPFSMVKSD